MLRAPDTTVPTETGLAWVPVAHDDCTQSSDEECDAIVGIVERAARAAGGGPHRRERAMTRNDILIVAPFNLQVRCLLERLPGIRIGSVDKFQGQEAPVVIVSLCASTLDEAPRGASFLLSPNRLNVAVSRAQALAIVVGLRRCWTAVPVGGGDGAGEPALSSGAVRGGGGVGGGRAIMMVDARTEAFAGINVGLRTREGISGLRVCSEGHGTQSATVAGPERAPAPARTR